MSSTSSQPLAWNTRSSSVPSPEAFERAGLVAPNQWSFPLNLPLSWLVSGRRTQVLPEDSADAPCLGV